MPLDPRTPVIIGVGQFLNRPRGFDDAIDPVGLMTEAAATAAQDAGLDGVPVLDSIRVVALLSWRYGDPSLILAERLGQSPRHRAVTAMGGNSPQSLLNSTCLEIQRGDLDIALLAGGEAWRTRMRAKRGDVELGWPKCPPEVMPTVIGTELEMNLPAEIERGIYLPIHVYPMFETAVRAASGASPDEHLKRISEMWARFSAVAARNPYAWSRDAKTAVEIRTASSDNRIIGLPYTKMMNSNNDVDMAAALLVCSAETATRLGVAHDRWVFPHAGTDCHEHQFVSNRESFARTPAIELGGRLALELAETTVDEIELIDLYSCFPSAVELGARSLGLDPFGDRELTLTGGLCFAGGPWNNYVMHAIATMVQGLRDRSGARGLIWANGGYATKHAFGVYGTDPAAPGFRHRAPQAEIDRLPRRELAPAHDAVGDATLEAYTVMFDRSGTPERAHATCLLDDGRRAWGIAGGDADITTALLEGEWVGRRVSLDQAGALQIA